MVNSELTQTTTLLLEGLRDPSNDGAWRLLHDRCYPLLFEYGRRKGLQPTDAEDAAQEALADFATAYREGEYDRARGRLRQWLYGFAAHRIKRVQQRNQKVGHIPNAEGRTQFFNDLPAPDEIDAIWETEWERHVLQLCREQIRREFQSDHVAAFEKYALEGLPPDEVAAVTGMSVNAVYICKSRILARLRELQDELAQLW